MAQTSSRCHEIWCPLLNLNLASTPSERSMPLFFSFLISKVGLTITFCLLFFTFQDRISLYTPGCPWNSKDQARVASNSKALLASASVRIKSMCQHCLARD